VIKSIFELNQGHHSDLQEDFKNRLTLMWELLTEMKKALAIPLKNPTAKASEPNQFFKLKH
jgi:hypothetical protein